MSLLSNEHIKHTMFVLSSVLPGLLFSLYYVDIVWTPLLLIVIYTALLFFIRIKIENNETIKTIIGFFFLTIPILYFTISYSLFSFLLLSLIALLLSSKILFVSYNLSWLYTITEFFITIVFLNTFSFYVQAHFIPLELISVFSIVFIGAILFRSYVVSKLYRPSSEDKKRNLNK